MSAEVDVSFEPMTVTGHLVIDGERQSEPTTIKLASGDTAQGTKPWEGPLGFEGLTTVDKRYLMPGEITSADLPLPLKVQIVSAEGHDNAHVAGSIDKIQHIPLAKFDRAEEFKLKGLPKDTVVIFGSGTLDGSPAAAEAERIIGNGAGISLDISHNRLAPLDPETFDEVPEDEIDLGAAMAGEYVTGIAGMIRAATIVTESAFDKAFVQIADGHAMVASASVTLRVEQPERRTLLAAAAPLKPLRKWFEDPQLPRLTPMTYTREGRVFGHLCDWTGCHTGFSHICVPPFRSQSNFAYFNVAEIECADGTMMPCGKLMFSMNETGHADANPGVDWREAAKHYDKATSVGAFVRAGADRHGIWLAGALRPGLSEDEVQHLRTHPPSGDWRPIPGKGSELIAAFSVAVPGFPIPHALVASAADGELTVITAPLVIEKLGAKAILRRMEVLRDRRQVLMTQAIDEFALESEDFADISAEQRRAYARRGIALPDGSFPIPDCNYAERAIHAQGRAPEAKRGRVKAHIRKRVRALGCSGDIFDPYK